MHLHGVAADDCVANGQGPIGLTASEVIEAARMGVADAAGIRDHVLKTFKVFKPFDPKVSDRP